MEYTAKRPISVRIEDFRKEMNSSVMKSELPGYLIEVLLNEYLTEIKKISQQEYAQGRLEWENMQNNTEPDTE